jgi:Leucine-rich repeat (LRR) protein
MFFQDSLISVITYEAFDNLPNLRYLDLRGNKLTQIDGAISKLSNLEYLDISYQCLDVGLCAPLALGDHSFKNMKLLKTLKVSGMNMFTLSNMTLEGLVNLEDLAFDHTSVDTIPSGFFNHTKNLKKLDLSYNTRLKTLPKDVFESQSNLEDLNLAHSSGKKVVN